MTNRLPLYLIVALLIATLTAACNDDSETYAEQQTYVNCAVTSFQLQRDDSVLTRLDSVFFAIDLINARIFNADSLPVGTKVDKLRIKVGTESAAECNVTYRIPGTDRDTTVNIIDEPDDSVNFADGPVRMEIVSRNLQAKRTYSVQVNVHKVAADTLTWSDEPLALPGGSGAVAQKTVFYKGEYVTLVERANDRVIATTDNPYYPYLSQKTVNLPAGADCNSFAATDDALYILAGKSLYRSTDKGGQWHDTGVRMDYIYGGYGDKVLGVRSESGIDMHVTYPASTVTAVPDGCPVSGTSQLQIFENKWSITPTALLIGGITSSGDYTGACWGYDGDTWHQISSTDLPLFADMTLIPYETPRVNYNNWSVTNRTALLAIGGRGPKTSTAGSDKIANDSVYVSYDMGITWAMGSANLQLPRDMKPFWGAQAYVVDYTKHADDSRAVRPVTEWEVPYIYVFGGYTAERGAANPAGVFYPYIRRGVINRYSFKPLI